MCRCRSLTPPPAEGPLHPPDGQLVVPSLGVAALSSLPGDVESPADTEEFEWTSVASFPYLATGGEAADQAEEEDAAVVEVFGGQARRQSIFDISRWVPVHIVTRLYVQGHQENRSRTIAFLIH